MLIEDIKDYNLILASKSPRRHYLLREIGLSFTVSDHHEVDENFPPDLNKYEIPVYLAELKSQSYPEPFGERDILITADTIVWFKNRVINKPADRREAISFLNELSGNMHEVITGVCIRGKSGREQFFSHSEVFFGNLSREEIIYYVDRFRPFDKAGAYGIQEWIGYIGIKEIRGSFYNVMGMPVHLLYQKLNEFVSHLK